jgi:hypothetical protein
VHPLFLIPAAIVGFLFGTKATKKLSDSEKKGPIPGFVIPIVAWERFIAIMAIAPKGNVSKRYKLGTFGMDARKLKDVGVMKTAVKGVYGDEDGVWLGAWTSPLTEEGFLGSMPLQYAAFVRSMRAAAPKVSGLVGKKVDGSVASLSGLLGVAHAAGEAGVESWVVDPEIRRRFGRTTEMFTRTNQVF